jgi:hypothetical protein
MKYLKDFKIFESESKKDKMIEDFEKEFGTELDENFEENQIKLLKRAFSLFNKKFIKNKIPLIKLNNTLKGVHGRWEEKGKKSWMELNPKIFNYKKEFEDYGKEIPYNLFIIVHEIGHCTDHVERTSYSKEWQSISGWKKCDINKKIPDGYTRYIEKRTGREIAGPKKSDWIHKEDADFVRRYASRNPREDFADSFAFGVFELWDRFKGKGCKEKMAMIKDVLKIVE